MRRQPETAGRRDDRSVLPAPRRSDGADRRDRGAPWRNEREAVSYKAFDGVIEALTRYLRGLDVETGARIVGEDAALAARIFPVLRRVAAVRHAARLVEIPNPQELRTRAFATLRALFRRLIDQVPVVLCMDDLQWADADSLSLLDKLLREPDAPSFLLLATMRTSAAEPAPGLRSTARELERIFARASRLHVTRLPPDEARELAAVLFEREGAHAPIDATALAEEAGGHPCS